MCVKDHAIRCGLGLAVLPFVPVLLVLFPIWLITHGIGSIIMGDEEECHGW